jgi:hypothetical protein
LQPLVIPLFILPFSEVQTLRSNLGLAAAYAGRGRWPAVPEVPLSGAPAPSAGLRGVFARFVPVLLLYESDGAAVWDPNE